MRVHLLYWGSIYHTLSSHALPMSTDMQTTTDTQDAPAKRASVPRSVRFATKVITHTLAKEEEVHKEEEDKEEERQETQETLFEVKDTVGQHKDTSERKTNANKSPIKSILRVRVERELRLKNYSKRKEAYSEIRIGNGQKLLDKPNYQYTWKDLKDTEESTISAIKQNIRTSANHQDLSPEDWRNELDMDEKEQTDISSTLLGIMENLENLDPEEPAPLLDPIVKRLEYRSKINYKLPRLPDAEDEHVMIELIRKLLEKEIQMLVALGVRYWAHKDTEDVGEHGPVKQSLFWRIVSWFTDTTYEDAVYTRFDELRQSILARNAKIFHQVLPNWDCDLARLVPVDQGGRAWERKRVIQWIYDAGECDKFTRFLPSEETSSPCQTTMTHLEWEVGTFDPALDFHARIA